MCVPAKTPAAPHDIFLLSGGMQQGPPPAGPGTAEESPATPAATAPTVTITLIVPPLLHLQTSCGSERKEQGRPLVPLVENHASLHKPPLAMSEPMEGGETGSCRGKVGQDLAH